MVPFDTRVTVGHSCPDILPAVEVRNLAAVLAGLMLTVPGLGVTAQPPDSPPPYEPCPVVELDPPPGRPAPPEPPSHGPGDLEVGGPGMATAGLVVPELAPELPDNLTATSWVVADLDSGAVLGACGPHEYGLPASTQKLLLALALLDELDPDREVEVVPEDLNYEPGSSAVGLLAGGTYRVETLWLGLLLNSGNDAARVLARVGGGDRGIAGGVGLMNRTAALLGANQTHAVTPSGLDGPGQFTSAYDLALIARQLFQRDDFLEYTATRVAQVPAQPPRDPHGFQIQNQNPLLTNYDGALGGKTGYTDRARHTYVGAAERDGRRLVVTLLGAEARPAPAWAQAAALLDWGFAVPPQLAVGRLVEPGEVYVPAVLPHEMPEPTPTGLPPAGPGEVSASGIGQAVEWISWVVGGAALTVFVCGMLLMLARAVVRRH